MSVAAGRTDNDSLLSKVLPQVVQKRVRKVSSIRRSLSWAKDERETESQLSSPASDGISTPPPRYQSRQSSYSNDIDLGGMSMSPIGQVRSRSNSIAFPSPHRKGGMSDSEVNWKYADQGCNLLLLSQQEADHGGSAYTHKEKQFSRQLYVHALTYLLRGLPEDLSSMERESVKSSLPGTLREDIAETGREQQLMLLKQVRNSDRVAAAESARRSWIHQSVAWLVVQVILLLNLLLPYLQSAMAYAYRVERKHRLSERAYGAWLDGMEAVGRKGMIVWSIKEGHVGQSINAVVVFFVLGVTGGLHEGIGEGWERVSKVRTC